MRKLMIGLLAGAAMACANQGGNQAEAATADNQAAANATAAALPDADPAMWVVRDADTTIYLFGTFHLLDGKTQWLNDEVKEALDSSQEVVFEADMPEGEQEMIAAMQPLILKYAVDQKGRTISSRLSAEQNKALGEAFKKMGAPAAAFDKFEPWFVAMTLSGVSANNLGLKPEHGAEMVIRNAAASRNVKFGAVETLEDQIVMFDTMPEDLQLQQLKDTLDDMGKADDMTGRMLTAWQTGDAESLDRVMNEGMSEYPALRKALLADRNSKWAEWIDQRLDKPGVVFMAVGAGHLVGSDSVQTFLAKRNIQSQRVPNQTP